MWRAKGSSSNRVASLDQASRGAASHAAPGYYGKLVSRGDFVQRRLPRSFVNVWDQWLQDCLRALQQAPGREAYLTAPIWRFVLSARICGEQAWAGVLMPSVDRVGRYFPLTLASEYPRTEPLQRLLTAGAEWYTQLESAALSCLKDALDLDALDTRLGQLKLSASLALASDAAASAEAAQLLPQLRDAPQRYSLWWTQDHTAAQQPFICADLPPPRAALRMFGLG